MKKITEHFFIEEFTKRDPLLMTPIQMMMLQNLCHILECIRKFLGDGVMKVTDGIRLPSDINRLRKEGWNPSETSDHLFGNIVKLRNKIKIKIFGKYYVYSVGACDVVPACGAKEAFDLMLPYIKSRHTGEVTLPNGTIKVGQIILERRVVKGVECYWLHISNPPDLIYSDTLVGAYFNRKHFLKSLDNGGSYEAV